MKVKTTHEYICKECDKITTEDKFLKAPHPFQKGIELFGCPACLEIDLFVMVCEVINCKSQVTCGTPTKTKYRNLCGNHYTELENEQT